MINLRKMELSRKRLTRNKNKREQRRTGGGGRLGHYIHHRNCHGHKSLLALGRQRRISLIFGKLVEMKDLICGSQKLVNDIIYSIYSAISCLYPPYSPIHCSIPEDTFPFKLSKQMPSPCQV